MKHKRCPLCTRKFERELLYVCLNCYPASEYGAEEDVDKIKKELVK